MAERSSNNATNSLVAVNTHLTYGDLFVIMSTVTKLNTYVQSVSRADPMFVLKRDGDTEPPQFVGTLSAPGFTTVVISSANALASKTLVRKELVRKFTEINDIDLERHDIRYDRGSDVRSFHSVVQDHLGTPKTTAELHAISHCEGVTLSYDDATFQLLRLAKADLVQYKLVEKNGIAVLLWELTATTALDNEMCARLLSFLSIVITMGVPERYRQEGAYDPHSVKLVFMTKDPDAPGRLSRSYQQLRVYSTDSTLGPILHHDYAHYNTQPTSYIHRFYLTSPDFRLLSPYLCVREYNNLATDAVLKCVRAKLEAMFVDLRGEIHAYKIRLNNCMESFV